MMPACMTGLNAHAKIDHTPTRTKVASVTLPVVSPR